MKTQQKALIVWMDGDKTRGLDELNIALGRGWRVAHAAPMGGAGTSRKELRFASLVVVEREEEAAAEALLAEEEQEEPIVDGNGDLR